MPVTVELINNPPPADQTDLIKIYNDAPDWLKTGSAEHWVSDQLVTGSQCVYGARFNDRLLAAAVICPVNDIWQLTWLNVRAVTRNRGVGRRFITELQRIATEHHCRLIVLPANVREPLPSYLQALL